MSFLKIGWIWSRKKRERPKTERVRRQQMNLVRKSNGERKAF